MRKHEGRNALFLPSFCLWAEHMMLGYSRIFVVIKSTPILASCSARFVLFLLFADAYVVFKRAGTKVGTVPCAVFAVKNYALKG